MHQDVVIVDRETGAIAEATRGRTPARRQPIGFSSDDSALYLLTDSANGRVLKIEQGKNVWRPRTQSVPSAGPRPSPAPRTVPARRPAPRER